MSKPIEQKVLAVGKNVMRADSSVGRVVTKDFPELQDGFYKLYAYNVGWGEDEVTSATLQFVGEQGERIMGVKGDDIRSDHLKFVYEK